MLTRYAIRTLVTTVACSATLASLPASMQAMKLSPMAPSVHSGARATIQVQNDRKVPVTVFVERGDFDRRLGSVHAAQTKALRIPETIGEKQDEIELFVTPELGLGLSSQSVELTRGAHLGLEVPLYRVPPSRRTRKWGASAIDPASSAGAPVSSYSTAPGPPSARCSGWISCSRSRIWSCCMRTSSAHSASRSTSSFSCNSRISSSALRFTS